jgi:hypothetical protein
VAVLQGFAPEVGWRALAEAAVAIRAGASWVATNVDRTLPSPRGPLPGNGSLVAALATATGEAPEVVGKPEPALFHAALDSSRTRNALMVGDRLDTDVAGARGAGLPALLVLTGVSRPADVVTAPPAARPTYLGRDLGALELAHEAPHRQGDAVRCGSASARMADGKIELSGGADGDGLDGLRALCGLAWRQADHHADLDWDPLPYVEAVEGLNLEMR